MTYRLCALLVLFSLGASARVAKIEISERSDVAGTYERLIGTAHFAVDPKLAANQIVSDIKYAPLNAAGMVEFSADLYVLKPKDAAKSNHSVIFEVSNRGGKGMLGVFDRSTVSDDPGDKMLLDQGYTIVWLGWEWDVAKRPGLLRLNAPVATDHGKPITGLVLSEYEPEARTNVMPLGDRALPAYPVLEARDLTVRDTVTSARRTISSGNWTVRNGTEIVYENGFEPGKIYEFVYLAKDPVLAGLGGAGIRDLISFLKYGGDDSAVLGDQYHTIRQAYGFGISQSGRFLRKFLYDGFNADEKGRKVFDGLMVHVGGAGLGSFNMRFAQPSRDGHPFLNLLYPTDVFPFTDLPETDPETGAADALLARAVKANVVPKIFYTNSSYEYWGRSAALIHISPDAKRDAVLADTTRIYMFAGGQHSPAAKPTQTVTLNPTNPNDYRWSLRALLVAMDAWVKNNTAPPDSAYPRIADGTLVAPDAVHFPAVPGQHVPAYPKLALRFDFGPDFATGRVASIQPPRVGDAFPVRVPQSDADGIDLGGIRMPEVAVPVATYTGWNPRAPSIGAPDQLYAMAGSFIPLPLTEQQARASHDPRQPIASRYPNRDAYLAKVKEAAQSLVAKRLLLEGDIDALVQRAGTEWDLVHGH